MVYCADRVKDFYLGLNVVLGDFWGGRFVTRHYFMTSMPSLTTIYALITYIKISYQMLITLLLLLNKNCCS